MGKHGKGAYEKRQSQRKAKRLMKEMTEDVIDNDDYGYHEFEATAKSTDSSIGTIAHKMTTSKHTSNETAAKSTSQSANEDECKHEYEC